MTSEIARRYDRVAGRFTATVDAVEDSTWDEPAPCDGWVARDVVAHLVEWVPAFPLARAGITVPDHPPTNDDPRRAWHVVDDTIRQSLADPALAARTFETPMGTVTFEQAIATFCIPDVLVHTWDLARATGQDDRLDPDEVHRALEEMRPVDTALRESGQYGPRVDVPADADEQTQLIAFTGRRP